MNKIDRVLSIIVPVVVVCSLIYFGKDLFMWAVQEPIYCGDVPC